MDIVIAQTDILTVKAELIVLKYADAFHGADRAVARAVDFKEHLARGDVRLLQGKNVAAQWVLFMGVGPLHEFPLRTDTAVWCVGGTACHRIFSS